MRADHHSREFPRTKPRAHSRQHAASHEGEPLSPFLGFGERIVTDLDPDPLATTVDRLRQHQLRPGVEDVPLCPAAGGASDRDAIMEEQLSLRHQFVRCPCTEASVRLALPLRSPSLQRGTYRNEFS